MWLLHGRRSSVCKFKTIVFLYQSNDYFSFSSIPSLHQLQCLYICRCKAIWTLTNSKDWLEENAKFVAELYKKNDPIIVKAIVERKKRYGYPPRPVLRHVILSDFKQDVPLSIFLKEKDGPILAYDPLPPTDSVNYTKK